ncbi:putative flavanone 3-dioxygenase [Helianthus annuus]|nr:putative flavanone 3-dioxygenase [Helianthus annuus]KAJ0641387.1 putative flavanone 3-dioxygenase [Helianthus annuus]KAJ0645284.1 putative flavanone 3-dioxygenase [Helianthus annuus]
MCFNIRTEKVANWRDYLRLHCYPIDNFIDEWPTNPASFRAHLAEYCQSTRNLALQLIVAISESLGLHKDYMNTQLGKHAQHMVLNYYPPCPQPDLTYALLGNTDPNFISILLQDEVPGLQVLKDGKWVAVYQVMSNDKYKSILHRAVVNCDKERISIPTFYCPSPEAVSGPTSEVVSDDEPAVYRQFTYGEYYEKFNGIEKCLDMFKTS